MVGKVATGNGNWWVCTVLMFSNDGCKWMQDGDGAKMNVLGYLFNTRQPWSFFYLLLQKPCDHPCRRAGEEGFFVSTGTTTSHNLQLNITHEGHQHSFACRYLIFRHLNMDHLLWLVFADFHPMEPRLVPFCNKWPGQSSHKASDKEFWTQNSLPWVLQENLLFVVDSIMRHAEKEDEHVAETSAMKTSVVLKAT